MEITNGKDISKESKRIRWASSLLMIMLMTATAEILGEKEIIFPEIAALVIGAWFADRQPWIVNKVQFVLLMTISAVMGIVIVRYVPILLFGQVVLGLCFAAIALIVTKTTMVPMISACILPIYLGTRSVIYPISVCIMAVMIVCVQWCFDEKNYVEKVVYYPVERKNKDSILYYGKRILVFLVIACVPIFLGKLYVIAPPLIVTFMEFSNEKAKIRGKYKEVMILMGIASVLGTCSRLVFHEQMGLSLTFCTFVIISCMLLAFTVVGVPFPPAGAISMLPLILKVPGLVYYPAYVCMGSVLLIFVACFCFKEKKK